ncbi:MAG: protein kinase [Oligoflexales bacterium]
MPRSPILRGTLSLVLLIVTIVPACRTTDDEPVSISKNKNKNKKKKKPRSFLIPTKKESKQGIEVNFRGHAFKLQTADLDISENEKPLPSFARTHLSSGDENKFLIDSARINSKMYLEGISDKLRGEAKPCFAFIFDDFSQELFLFKDYQLIDQFLRTGSSPVLVSLTGKICVDTKNLISKIILDSRFNSEDMLSNLSYLLNLDQAKNQKSLAKSGLAELYKSLGLPDLVEQALVHKPGNRLGSHLGAHNLFRNRVWKKVLESSKVLRSRQKKSPSSNKDHWQILYQRNQHALVRHGVKLAEVLLSNELSKRSKYIAGGLAYLKTLLTGKDKGKLKNQVEFTYISPLYDGSLATSETWKIIPASLSKTEIIIQFSEGLGFLHAQKLIHGSLQLDKLLFDGRSEHLLLTDLSHSKNIKDGLVKRDNTAHPNKTYLAHEVRENKPFDPFKAEVYSWGLVALEIKHGGNRPVLKENFKTKIDKPSTSYLPKKKPSYRGALVASMKLDLKLPLDRLIFDALNPKPNERPSMEMVLASLKKKK